MMLPLQIASTLRETLRPRRMMWRGELKLLVDQVAHELAEEDGYMPGANAFPEGEFEVE